MASYYIKSPMELYDVCVEDQSYGDKHEYVHRMGHYMRLHAHVPMCSQRRIYREPVTWELHMHGELPKEYSFIYSAHVHKSVRVTVRACSHILL